jgi:hypothetical protein
MYSSGAVFDTSVSLSYTRFNIYGSEPILLGNYSEVRRNADVYGNLTEFYSFIHKPDLDDWQNLLNQYLGLYLEFTIRKNYYFYFNSLYWYINIVEPYFKITYDKVPLPGA